MFDLCEKEAKTILGNRGTKAAGGAEGTAPILAAYDFCLKCSHLFNVLDSRGAISTTERAALIGRVRALCCRVASEYCAMNGWNETAQAAAGAPQTANAQERQ